ncbi:hypothetical protein DVK85_01485 [Flavobacterium arcticum]|uniref:Uncharacterized protein n=1 Tax=Flavobacterium arcticum TaxID=1784713 RepID=A0A345H8R4_9FLAO|nr:hypothetical protein [Flavobacterium arcticum]AXG72974.1 hypothetical protein DVK85_01485 [Flavobacterium arcticum]KAF2510362.1 hypothetical protein E0W72_07720 [Flavobacterium arcticum]
MQKLFKSNPPLQKAFHNAPDTKSTDGSTDTGTLCYAIAEEGQVVKRMELIQSNGCRYSFSYALLPVCIQKDSGLLFLKAYELLIRISGYNLDPIREYINTEQLIWAKASVKPDGTAETFIQEITIEGESVSTVL